MIQTLQTIPSTYTSVRQACAWWQESQTDMIVVAGPEARDYLQTQITQDISNLEKGQGISAALVNRKGQISALFQVFCQNTELFWLLPENDSERLFNHLESYHFVEKLTLKKESGYVLFKLAGPETERLIQQISGKKWALLNANSLVSIAIPGGSAWLIPQFIYGESGAMLLCLLEQVEALKSLFAKQFQIPELEPEAQEILRIEAGLPKFGTEILDDTLLPETGLEMERVSYNKGCYLGQEVIARIKAYGRVPKALMGLVFVDKAPSPGLLLIEGKKLGEITSISWSPQRKAFIALAYIHKKWRQDGLSLDFECQNLSYSAVVCRLPFYLPPSTKQQAEKLYEEALSIFAGSQEERAIPLLEAAIQKDPQLIDAYESLGVILSRQGRHIDAIEVIKQWVEIAPDEPMAHTNLSRFYMLLGDKPTAEEHMAEAARLSMRKEMSQQQAKQAIAQDRAQKEQMLAMFQEVLESEDPDDLVANFGLGKAFVDLERYLEAIPYLKKAVEIDPYYSAAYLQLGKALEQSQQLPEAREIYLAGIEAASEKGDLMPKKEMEARLLGL